jgi:hypothetical protein
MSGTTGDITTRQILSAATDVSTYTFDRWSAATPAALPFFSLKTDAFAFDGGCLCPLVTKAIAEHRIQHYPVSLRPSFASYFSPIHATVANRASLTMQMQSGS